MQRTTPPSRAARDGTAMAVVARGMAPFARLTLSGRRTTASGRSPGSRVSAISAAFSGTCIPNGELAARLAAYSCRGSPGIHPRSLLIPLRGTCRWSAPIPVGCRVQEPGACARPVPRLRWSCPTLALALSRACALWRSAIGPPGQGCLQGLNREVRARGVIPLESGTAPATVTGDAPRQHAIGTARCREGGGRRADSKKSGPGSQETGPQPSILRAGGMYRADGGHARCGALLPADPAFRETTSRTCAQEDRTAMPPCPFRLSDTAPSGRYPCLPA